MRQPAFFPCRTGRLSLLMIVCAGSLAACKPAGPPPDLVQKQREALEKARNVEGQVQQQDDERRRVLEDATR
jgi:hypothetical protein